MIPCQSKVNTSVWICKYYLLVASETRALSVYLVCINKYKLNIFGVLLLLRQNLILNLYEVTFVMRVFDQVIIKMIDRFIDDAHFPLQNTSV